MNTVLRFKEYLNYKGIKNAHAERDCGLSNGLIKSAISAGSAFGSDKLEKILNTYDDLSAEWLLRGTGNMIIGEELSSEQIFERLGMPTNSDKIIELWKQFMDVTQGMQQLYQQSFDIKQL